ncbi:hypothetical protein AcW2_007353 [Taiwanofungus camphoratus]|nr:hypothetical protein AcW2_007353 [Antrodia cinnamomea]
MFRIIWHLESLNCFPNSPLLTGGRRGDVNTLEEGHGLSVLSGTRPPPDCTNCIVVGQSGSYRKKKLEPLGVRVMLAAPSVADYVTTLQAHDHATDALRHRYLCPAAVRWLLSS